MIEPQQGPGQPALSPSCALESFQLEGRLVSARPHFGTMDHAPSTGMLRKRAFPTGLPQLMEWMLKDQEHHHLVKVIDRVLYKLNDSGQPYIHKILVAIEPVHIDEDYYACIEGQWGLISCSTAWLKVLLTSSR